jgi:putative membrane protein
MGMQPAQAAFLFYSCLYHSCLFIHSFSIHSWNINGQKPLHQRVPGSFATVQPYFSHEKFTIGVYDESINRQGGGKMFPSITGMTGFFYNRRRGMMDGYGFDYFRNTNPVVMWIGMGLGLLLFLVVIYLIVQLLRRSRGDVDRRDGRYDNPSSDALRILDERFAKGEITEEEYERRRSMLKK